MCEVELHCGTCWRETSRDSDAHGGCSDIAKVVFFSFLSGTLGLSVYMCRTYSLDLSWCLGSLLRLSEVHVRTERSSHRFQVRHALQSARTPARSHLQLQEHTVRNPAEAVAEAPQGKSENLEPEVPLPRLRRWTCRDRLRSSRSV